MRGTKRKKDSSSAEPFEGFTDDDIAQVEINLPKFFGLESNSIAPSTIQYPSLPSNSQLIEPSAELTVESYSFLDKEIVATDQHSLNKSIDIEENESTGPSTRTRVVKASKKLREATESDLIFAQSVGNRKVSKSISAILNASSGSRDSLNSSRESINESATTPSSLSRHDQELLRSGEAIDISQTGSATKTCDTSENNDDKSEISSPKPPRSNFKRAKAVKSIADTTTSDVPLPNDGAEISQGAVLEEKHDLSENVISSTSNDITTALTSIPKEHKSALTDTENEAAVSSSNLPDDAHVESSVTPSESEAEPSAETPMVSVDTKRVRAEIDLELKRLVVGESDFIKTILKDHSHTTFVDLLGKPRNFNLCSEEARRHYVEMAMWLTKEESKKMSPFKPKSPAVTFSQRMTSKKAFQKYRNAQRKRVLTGNESTSMATQWTKEQPKRVLDFNAVKVEAEQEEAPEIEGSNESSKRITRARLFSSPAKAAEERKCLHMNELYREERKKKLSDCVPSTSAILGEKLAKTIKRKVIKVEKVSPAKIEPASYEKSPKGTAQKEPSLKIGTQPGIVEKSAELDDQKKWPINTAESLDCYLSTSPVCSSSGASQYGSDGTSDPKHELTEESRLKSIVGRTKNVSRNDALLLAPEMLRVPKLRLSAIEDKSLLTIKEELPSDENEEFVPGNKAMKINNNIPNASVNSGKAVNETDVTDDESTNKRKRPSKTQIEPEKPAKMPLSCKTEKVDVAEKSKRRSDPDNLKLTNAGNKPNVDLRLADDDIMQWVSRITIGGIGNMIDNLGITDEEMRYANSSMALESMIEGCGLCDCCAMDLQCRECAQCVNGRGDGIPPCPLKQCLLHIMLKYLRGDNDLKSKLRELSKIWIVTRKTEQLVTNILFLRKCITSLSDCLPTDQPVAFEASKDVSLEPSVSDEKIGKIKSSSRSKGNKSTASSKSSKNQAAASGNIFALLGQKLASSRKRPNSNSSAAKSNSREPTEKQEIKAAPHSKIRSSMEANEVVLEKVKTESMCEVPPPKVLVLEANSSVDKTKLVDEPNVYIIEPPKKVKPLFEALLDFDRLSESTASSSMSADDQVLDWVTVEVAEIEVRAFAEELISRHNKDPFIPQRLLQQGSTKYCGNPGHSNSGNSSGQSNSGMTLRSSSDSILQLGYHGYDASSGSSSSPGRSPGDGIPPDSPDEKYWSFAAAAAASNNDEKGDDGDLRVSVEIPDYHYNDRMYLHKHGLPIIGTCDLPVASVCLICSSGGVEPMLYCSVCCDPFHVFCIDRKYRPISLDRAWSWVCRSCFSCRVCGQGSQLVECFVCQTHYHLSCISSDYYTGGGNEAKCVGGNDLRRKVTSNWKCPQCSKCESCFGVPQTQIEMNGVTHSLCKTCFKKIQQGQYCHLCLQVFTQPLFTCMTECGTTDDEADSSSVVTSKSGMSTASGESSDDCNNAWMSASSLNEQLNPNFEYIKCNSCNKWSHKQCEKLTEEHCDLIKQMLTKSQLVQPPKSGGDAASAEVRDASGTAADVKNIRFNFLCSGCTAEQNETYEGGSNSSWMAKVQFYLKSGLKSIMASLLRNKKCHHLVVVKPASVTQENNLTLNNDRAKSVPVGSKEIGLKALVPATKNGEFKTLLQFHEAILEIVKFGVEVQQSKHLSSTEEFVKSYHAEMKRSFPFANLPVIDVQRIQRELKQKKLLLGNIMNSIDNTKIAAIQIEHSFLDEDRRLILMSDVSSASKSESSSATGLGSENISGNKRLSNSNNHNYQDRRNCQLCMWKGDRPEKLEGRLLYCAQDEWVHVNCAVWSSEVEDECERGTASLKHVFNAIHRGKSSRCDLCKEHGATIGCGVKQCTAQCHFTCARQTNFLFLLPLPPARNSASASHGQQHAKTFCSQHRHLASPNLEVVRDFRVRRRVQVDLEEIKWKKQGGINSAENLSSNNGINTNSGQNITFNHNTVVPNTTVNYMSEEGISKSIAKRDSSSLLGSGNSNSSGCQASQDLYHRQSQVPVTDANEGSAGNDGFGFSNAHLRLADVRLQVGSLRVESIYGSSKGNRTVGSKNSCMLSNPPLSSLSDTKSAIIPIAYRATRLFWSTRDPTTRTLYHLSVSESTTRSPALDSKAENITEKAERPETNALNGNLNPLDSTIPVRLVVKSRRRSQSVNLGDHQNGFALNEMKSFALRKSKLCLEVFKTSVQNMPDLDTSTFDTEKCSPNKIKEDIFDPECFKTYLRNNSLEKFAYRNFISTKISTWSKKETLFCKLCGQTLTKLQLQDHYVVCRKISEKFGSLFPKIALRMYDVKASDKNRNNSSVLLDKYLKYVGDNFGTDAPDNFVLEILREALLRSRGVRAPKLLFSIRSDDGFEMQSHSLQEIWCAIFEQVWLRRIDRGILQKQVTSPAVGDTLGSNWRFFSKMDNMNCLKLSGLSLDSLAFLLEQIPSAKFCSKYKFRFFNLKVQPLHINESGCARCEPREDNRIVAVRRRDMFGWLSSRHRHRPHCDNQAITDLEYHFSNMDKRKTTSEYPIQMRYRSLKKTAKQVCGVFRSEIHGRGLYSLQAIFPDEMVIEYTGEIIRAVHTDKREKYYESKGIGCYMFRVDDKHVIDATVSGNAARFINHSCQPNCYSRVLVAENRKHIVIFASRHILRGEELTYDYKFDIEDDASKLHCHCKSRNCRKFLN